MNDRQFHHARGARSHRIGRLLAVLALTMALLPVGAADAADTTGPEVMHVTSCLAGAGRVDTNIVNPGPGSARYRIEFGNLSARELTVAALDWWRMPVTGRPNGDHDVTVLKDGEVVSQTTVTVNCSPNGSSVDGPEVQIVNACRAGSGYLLFQFLNATDAQRGYVIEFDSVPNRSTSAAAFGQSVRAVTGRPAGTHGYAIRTNGVITHTGQVQVDCEPKGNNLVPLPPQPAGVPYPTVSWPTDSLPATADASAVQSILTAAFGNAQIGDADASSAQQRAAQAAYGDITAALVISGGELVTEEYGNGYTGTTPHPSFSLAKSVTHALLGNLVDDGQLDVFAPAAVPEWSAPGDPRGAITPDMLARMSSGLEWDESPDVILMRFVTGLGGEAASTQVDRDLAEPDPAVNSRFQYSTGSTAINGRLMGDIVGRGTAFTGWADNVLFDPLGIDSAELEFDSSGNWIAGYGANMTARDFARFGLLYLRDGFWDGNQILPSGWVDYARTATPTNEDYGAGFWVNVHGENTFGAIGSGGQVIAIVPEQDLVVVVLADGTIPDSDRLARDLIAAFTPGD